MVDGDMVGLIEFGKNLVLLWLSVDAARVWPLVLMGADRV